MVESCCPRFVNITMDTLCNAGAWRLAIASFQDGRDKTGDRLLVFMLHFYSALPKVKVQ